MKKTHKRKSRGRKDRRDPALKPGRLFVDPIPRLIEQAQEAILRRRRV